MILLLQFLLAHLGVLALWAVVGLALTGIGLLYRRLFTKASPGPHQLLFAFWGGYAMLLFGLQVWHLAFSISAYPLVLTLAVGGLGLVLERKGIGRWLSSRPWVGEGVPIALTFVLLLWTANHALGPVTLYDSGMYHIPVVEWAKAYPIVPGLGNLHGRLAFNSAGLLFAAMLDHGPLTDRAFHVANGLLLTAFVLQGTLAWSHLLSSRVRLSRADVFDALLILPAVGLLIGGEISSLDTDVPVALMLLAAASRLHRSVTNPRSMGDDAERSHFATLCLLLGAAVCAKLSAVVLAGMLFVAAMWAYRRSIASKPVAGVLATAVPALMGIVWMARGVILSGYPVYPSSKFGASVIWRVPTAQANAEADWIRMSAHELNHNRIVAGFDWIGGWARELLTEVQFVFMVPVPLGISVILGVALLAGMKRRSAANPPPHADAAWFLIPPAIAGAVFWFLAAPHPRFGMGPLWIVAASMASIIFATLPDDDGFRRSAMRRVGVVLAASCLTVVVVLALAGSGGTSSRRGGVRSIAGTIIPPGPDHGLHPIPSAALVSYTTKSGLALAVPKDNNLCWAGPLLCTPHPAPNLRLRNPSDVGEGFVTDDGVWAPIRWPNPWTPFLPWLACRHANGAHSIDRDRACIGLTAKLPTDTLQSLTQPYAKPVNATNPGRGP